MGLLDKSYPDTYKGGQQCREDVDSARVILYGKEPGGYSKEFLRGFRDPGNSSDNPFGEFPENKKTACMGKQEIRMGKQIDKVDKVRNSTIEDCENCDEENCDIRHCLISGPHEDKFPPKADFLWPVEKGSVEEAGYEFANARTEDYRYDWWKILLVRAAAIEKLGD